MRIFFLFLIIGLFLELFIFELLLVLLSGRLRRLVLIIFSATEIRHMASRIILIVNLYDLIDLTFFFPVCHFVTICRTTSSWCRRLVLHDFVGMHAIRRQPATTGV